MSKTIMHIDDLLLTYETPLQTHNISKTFQGGHIKVFI